MSAEATGRACGPEGSSDLTRDAFLDGRLRLWQPRRGYRAATDPVFLAAFVPARTGDEVLDLGCGVGAAVLCLAARVPGLGLHGLEIQPGYAALARRNAAENGHALTVHDGDVADPPAMLRGRVFDQVIANPPFYRTADLPSPDPGRDRANRAAPAGLEAWVAAGLRRLRPDGTLTLIHPPDGLERLLGALAGQAGAIEILPVAPRAGRPAGRVLVRARKGRRTPLVLHPPFVVHAGDAHGGDREDHTEAARQVLRGGAALLP